MKMPNEILVFSVIHLITPVNKHGLRRSLYSDLATQVIFDEVNNIE